MATEDSVSLNFYINCIASPRLSFNFISKLLYSLNTNSSTSRSSATGTPQRHEATQQATDHHLSIFIDYQAQV